MLSTNQMKCSIRLGKEPESEFETIQRGKSKRQYDTE